MARFCPLYSGSSGNASYVGTGSGGILVDAGVSCKSILAALSAREIDPNQIEGVFITHEHIDHIRGLKVLLKKHRVPVYSSAPTLDYLIQNDMVPPGTRLEPMEGRTVELGSLSVTAFDTPHDAAGSVGYRIETADGRKVAVATDLGHVSETVREGITGCDLVLLEANYDPGMLRCSSYPYYLKRRIASENGHLSNDCCAHQVEQLVKTGSTRFVLAHLSRENNLPSLAFQTILGALQMAGCQENRDFTLSVAPRGEPGELVVF